VHRHRDRSIERMLQQGAGGARPPRSADGCLDAERLAAWASRSLSARETTGVEEHLADCDRCQAMLAAFAETAPPPAVHAPWWQRARVQWLVPAATAAIVFAVWVSLPERDVLQAPAAPVAREQQPPGVSPDARRETLRAPATVAPGSTTNARRPTAPPVSMQAAPMTPAPSRPSRGQPASVEKKSVVGRNEAAAVAKPEAPAEAQKPEIAPPAPVAEAVTGVSPSTATRTVPPTPAQPAMPARGPLADLRAANVLTIASPERDVLWRVLEGTQLQRSADGGSAWQRVEFRPAAAVHAGHAPSSAVLWLVGERGTIHISTDGRTFARVPFVDASSLVSVLAVDDREATVTTADGRTFRTLDRGATWTRF
jgi:hypothetical protein